MRQRRVRNGGSRPLRTQNWLPITLAAAYLTVVVIASIPMFLPDSGALSGVFAVMLTFPWSFLAMLAFDAIDPTLLDSPFLGYGAIAFSALVNAGIIYALSRSKRRGGDSGADAAA